MVCCFLSQYAFLPALGVIRGVELGCYPRYYDYHRHQQKTTKPLLPSTDEGMFLNPCASFETSGLEDLWHYLDIYIRLHLTPLIHPQQTQYRQIPIQSTPTHKTPLTSLKASPQLMKPPRVYKPRGRERKCLIHPVSLTIIKKKNKK
jgi:hypothetical protein